MEAVARVEATPPATAFNPGGRRFFAAVMSPPDEGNPQHLMYPHPGYHEYEVYEWLAPRGYQPVATLKGSPNAGDSRTIALDMATWLNERFPLPAPATDTHTNPQPRCPACNHARAKLRCDCGAPPEHAPDCSYISGLDDIIAEHADEVATPA